jgi:hypothetical protein
MAARSLHAIPEARSSEQAIHIAGSLAKMEWHCGALAFSRTGDPPLGDFDDAVILNPLVRSMTDAHRQPLEARNAATQTKEARRTTGMHN